LYFFSRLVSKLLDADNTDNQDQMKSAFAAFAQNHPQLDPVKLLADFNALRTSTDIVNAKRKRSEAETEVPNVTQRLDAEDKKVAQLKSQINELDVKKNNLEIEFRSLIRQKDNAESKLRELNEDLNNLHRQENTIYVAIEQLKAELAIAKAALSTWQRQLAALRAEERRAYDRFWLQTAALSAAQRERLEDEIKTAGDEYFESVFPREDTVSRLIMHCICCCCFSHASFCSSFFKGET